MIGVQLHVLTFATDSQNVYTNITCAKREIWGREYVSSCGYCCMTFFKLHWYRRRNQFQIFEPSLSLDIWGCTYFVRISPSYMSALLRVSPVVSLGKLWIGRSITFSRVELMTSLNIKAYMRAYESIDQYHRCSFSSSLSFYQISRGHRNQARLFFLMSPRKKISLVLFLACFFPPH